MVLLTLLGFLLDFNRFVRYGFVLVSVAVFIVGVTPLSNWLIYSLEKQYPLVALDDSKLSDVTGFIVLGGMIQEDTSNQLEQVQMTNSSDRGTNLIQLLHTYPDKRFVFTGGSPSIFDMNDKKNEAELFEDFLKESGINTENIIFEKKSRDTIENALLSYEIIQPKPDEHWVIVTSAFHMPRSVTLFKRAGWQNISAYPVDYRHKTEYHFSFSDNLKLFEIAQKEYFALAWYKVTKIMGSNDDDH